MFRIAFLIAVHLLSISAFADKESDEIIRSKGILTKTDDPKVLVGVYNDLAWEYYYTNFDSSMKYVQLAIKLSEDLEDVYWKSVSLEMLAILKDVSGQVEEALNLYFEVIKLRESIGGEGLENTYNNVAAIFRNQENYEKALVYFRKSYAMEEDLNNPPGIAASLINIGLTLMRMNDVDSIEGYYSRAMSISDSIGDPVLMADVRINLAEFLQQQGQTEAAWKNYESALTIAGSASLVGSTCVASFGLAEIAHARGDHRAALQWLEKALSAALQINNLEYLSRVFGIRAVVHAAQGEYRKAFEDREMYIVLKDSVSKTELLRLTTTLEARFASEQKERRIAELQLDATERALDAVTSKNQRNLLFSLAIILVLGVVFLAYRYALQQKVSRLLAQKNKTIEEALRDRETLLKEIHHRVKNNLQVVSSLLSIQGREITDEKALEAVNESKHRVQSMALIHQYLYSENDLKSIDMQQYVSQLSKNLFAAYRTDHDAVELKLDVDMIMLDVDTAIPVGIILNELITNALKYAFPDGEGGRLLVALKIENGRLNLRVADSGVGFSGETKGDFSFGMKLLNAFKQKLEAEIIVRSDGGADITYSIGKFKSTWGQGIAS